MPEKEISIQQVLLIYTCDLCNEGEMNYTTVIIHERPIKYQHRCDKCDKKKNLSSVYPKLKSVRI